MRMILFDDACGWLNQFNESSLEPGSQQLVKQLKDHVQAEEFEDAWSTIERLRHVSLKIMRETEVAEILVNCAWAAFHLGNLDEAALLLNSAISRCGYGHNSAIAQWMLGHVFWEVPGRHDDAMISWQKSLSTFEKLARGKALTSSTAQWYQERWIEMYETLTCALEKDCLPKQAPSMKTSAARIHSASKPGPLRNQDFLRVATVSEIIPAGGFAPVRNDPYPIGFVDVTHVEIGSCLHSVRSLRSSRMVTLPPVGHYQVIKVSGVSMDQMDIQDGDYVLLHLQDDAKDQDIVAAEIAGEDNFATLKLFLRRPDKIILSPRSSNPAYGDREFRKNDDGFFIRGIALAVFKPIQKEN